jgi:hypothetical protein
MIGIKDRNTLFRLAIAVAIVINLVSLWGTGLLSPWGYGPANCYGTWVRGEIAGTGVVGVDHHFLIGWIDRSLNRSNRRYTVTVRPEGGNYTDDEAFFCDENCRKTLQTIHLGKTYKFKVKGYQGRAHAKRTILEIIPPG